MSGQASVALSAVLAGAVLLAVVARTPAPSKEQETDGAAEQVASPPRASFASSLRLPAPPPLPTVAPVPVAAVHSDAEAIPAEQPGKAVDATAATPRPTPQPVVASPARRQGRTLLRLLEHGQGPVIELAWPEDRAGREQLYRRLSLCHGMRTAVARADGGLFTADLPSGQPWVPDLDRYSGYMRATAGAMPAAEQTAASDIRARHGLPAEAATVRLFPRRMDAELLGGLRALIGPDYRTSRTIHGRYVLSGKGVLVRDLSADGRAVAGLIALSAGAGCAG